MPTVFTHALVAAAGTGATGAGRLGRRVLWLALLCSLLPDADVLGFRLGVAYGDPLGHRGASHSLAFALALGLAVKALAFPRLPLTSRAGAGLALFFAAVTASHGLLDAATSGGRGVALLWPVSDARFFLPWRPIPVSPIAVHAFVGARGVSVLAGEILWLWLPVSLGLGALALWRRRGAARARPPSSASPS